MSLILGTSVAGSGGEFRIERSLRFNSADSAYLNRTPASAGNRRLWTYSFWVKRSAITSTGSGEFLIRNGSTAFDTFRFDSDFTLQLTLNDGTNGSIKTSALFRDVSAWYHVVVRCETSNATANDRLQIYVNNVRQALSTNTQPSQNYDTITNTAVAHGIGGPTTFFSGLMTEVNFIDGQALTPSSFGETDLNTGVWKPKKYTGTYGTNGFYLNFADNSGTTSTTLGKDSSGNGNNWTPNNFSVTAGAGNDSLVDTPTPYGSDTGAGGNVRGNYSTWNPLNAASAYTLSNGNLDFTATAADTSTKYLRGTFGVSSGKWYWEVTPSAVGSGPNLSIGIQNITYTSTTGTVNTCQSGNAYYAGGQKENTSGQTSYGASYTANDVIGVALDLDNRTITFYKNNVSQGTAFSSLSGTFVPLINFSTSGVSRTITGVCNFGQRPFAYTAPSGFKALCTTNLPTPTIGATSTTQANDYFDVVTYTGDGTNSRTITSSLGFTPDFAWGKSRSAALGHVLVDKVRGNYITLQSNTTGAETSINSYNLDTANSLITWNSNETNQNTATYVTWLWKANGAGSTNTAGTITSTVSANTTAGFSIVTYTGNGTAGATVGHGLGVAPQFMFFKRRSAADDWPVYHVSIGATDRLILSGTGASSGDATFFNDTTPTSTVFSIGTNTRINANTSTYVAYCFAPVAGYSAFSSYTGNGSADGPFVYTGFRPRYLLLKASSGTTGDWNIIDTARDTANLSIYGLDANSAGAENSTRTIDILSNGFKLRGTGTNTNAATYIYAAFAESPFKYSLAR